MGDLLMSLPAIQLLRRQFPEASITLGILEENRPLLENHPDIDRLMICPPAGRLGGLPLLRLSVALRRERFDAALALNPTQGTHFAFWLAGIPIRAGYRRKWSFLLNRTLADTKAQRDLHEVDYNLELIDLLGVSKPSVRPCPHLSVPPAAEAEADRILRGKGLPSDARPIALHPWTSNPAKAWPLESFGEAARRLVPDHPILVIGGAENRPLMDRLGARLFPPEAADLVGAVPLGILPALLKRCRLLLSNDSGPVHVAAAVGTRTLVVAPPSHARQLNRWRPLGEGHALLFSPPVEEVVARCES